MSASYQHPIRRDIPLVIAYPTTGPSQGYATLHAEGCSHTRRRQSSESIIFSGDEAYTEDDYFEVAPCARTSKSRRKAENS